MLLASFFVQLLGLISPIFFQRVIDKVLVHNGLTTLQVLIIGLSAASLFEVLLTGLRTYTTIHTTGPPKVRQLTSCRPFPASDIAMSRLPISGLLSPNQPNPTGQIGWTIRRCSRRLISRAILAVTPGLLFPFEFQRSMLPVQYFPAQPFFDRYLGPFNLINAPRSYFLQMTGNQFGNGIAAGSVFRRAHRAPFSVST